MEFLLWPNRLRKHHSVHEDMCLIPDLPQGVKDLALLQASVFVIDVAWILHSSGYSVGWKLYLWFDPYPRNSYML